MSGLINSLGLFSDIVGAIFILKFGIPTRVDYGGPEAILTEGPTNQEEPRLARRYKRLSALGLYLVILGFILQLIASWI